MDSYTLKDREKAILRYIIHQFIMTANPVGSRYISKKYDIGLSPASIRNIMSDLEDLGYLNHPHTSAGRIPTDKGYRVYVDSLMDPPKLDKNLRKMIDSNFDTASNATEDILLVASNILTELTNQIAVVSFPKFDNAVLEKIQIVLLSSTRILVIISVISGVVRTITLELNAEVKEEQINKVQSILNEKLGGLKFSEIKTSIGNRVKDIDDDSFKPIVRVFLDSVDKIFKTESSEKTIISGTKNLIKQPEFESVQHFQSIIELIENKDIIIHILETQKSNVSDITITIGHENSDEKFCNYSMISKEYTFGDVKGTLGIMGPKRMEYPRIVAAVQYIADQLSNELKKQI